jgi:Ca-activated chloride channel family protein
MRNENCGVRALKGHISCMSPRDANDVFSRAAKPKKRTVGFSPRGKVLLTDYIPSAAKVVIVIRALSARLKPCPFKAVRLASCLTLSFLVSLALPAQETTLHVDVKLVNLFVNVTDKNGSIIGDLTRDDFSISEDGRPQQISLFERQSELPLNITLAIDTSGSVRKDMAEEADAARRFAHAIMRPQDQMRLLQFATYVTELTPFTNKVALIDRGLGQLHSDFATALYDAISLGAEGLGPREGRKVLVLVSDGGDTAKNTTYAQALEQALRNEVMIYSIIDVPIEASAGRDLGGEHALITLAEQTGGKSFYVSAGGLDKAFQQVSDDLRTQYLLGYYPKNQEPGRAFHRLQVTIPRAAPDAFNIRHKTGYYMNPSGKGE